MDFRSKSQERSNEGRLEWIAITALRLGTSVVLDFGVWSRDERCAAKPQAVYIRISIITRCPTIQTMHWIPRRCSVPGDRFGRMPVVTWVLLSWFPLLVVQSLQ